MSDIELKVVGRVRTSVPRAELKHREGLSEIIVESAFEEALEGVDGFSHLFVLFWLHEVGDEARETLKTHPRGRADMPLVGVFSTRSPHRPNPIGLTRVRLVSRHGPVLTVEGLDAFDGTPVLDIKPCDPWETEEEAQVPDWWLRLEEERDRRKPKA